MSDHPQQTPQGNGSNNSQPWETSSTDGTFTQGQQPTTGYGTEAGTSAAQSTDPYAGQASGYGTPTDPYAASQPQSGYPSQPNYQGQPTYQEPAGTQGQTGYGTAQPGYGTGQPGYDASAQYGMNPYANTTQGYGYGAAPQLSSWIRRVAASIIDSIPGGILSAISSNFTERTDAYGNVVHTGSPMIVFLCGVLSFGWSLWNRWIRAGRTGQSIGKSILGMKLVNEADGQPIGVGKAFLRDLAHILDSLVLMLGYLWPLWDKKRQTWADKIVHSVVIDAK